jgi:hypothetical protein
MRRNQSRAGRAESADAAADRSAEEPSDVGTEASSQTTAEAQAPPRTRAREDDAPASDDGRGPTPSGDTVSWAGRMTELLNVIGPTTAVTALLFYFGFIGTRARFRYFGVYLDLTDLSNQDLALYGLEVLYAPAALTFLVVLAGVTVHAGISWLITVPTRDGLSAAIASAAALIGALLIARATLGLALGRVAETEVPGTTALALACGPALTAYAAWIAAKIMRRRHNDARHRSAFSAWYGSAPTRRLRRTATIAVFALFVAGLFWAVNSFAWAFGLDRAYHDALDLPSQPEVVLDTREPLGELPDGVTETTLSTDANANFRYRYRGLRLLLEAGGRLFLVPEYWTEESRTIVVPYDSQVRLQLIP